MEMHPDVDDAVKQVIKEYFDIAKDLCRTQQYYMAKVDKMYKAIKDPKLFLSIINHVQLPAVQVHVYTDAQEKQAGGSLTMEQCIIQSHLPEAQELPVGCKARARRVAGMMHFFLYKQVTGRTAGQQKCAEKFKCGLTPFKHIITGKWQEGSKGKGGTQKLSRLIAQVAKAEQEGKETKSEEPASKKVKKTPKKKWETAESQ